MVVFGNYSWWLVVEWKCGGREEDVSGAGKVEEELPERGRQILFGAQA
jgi:hypothetical protein